MTKEQKALCDTFYDETSIDLAYIMEQDKPEDIDALMEIIQERVYEIEVIYYHHAMDYLLENDPSLQLSIGLAHDMGTSIENVNSELLATLLKQQNVSEEVGNYRDELEEAFFSN